MMYSDKPREFCYQCYRPSKACFCNQLISFDTYFTFRILMHPKEARPGHIGTGRISNLILNNCEVIIGEHFDENIEVQNLLSSEEYFPMLLYPGENSVNLSKNEISQNMFEGKRPLLFIIDGTWPCAKTMVRDSRCLHHLPRLSFDSCIVSKYSVRLQPAKFCLSTIESIYQVLLQLKKSQIESLGEEVEMLPRALEKLVAFQIACANDEKLQNHHRVKPLKKNVKTPRRPAKRWETRKVFFESS